MKIFYRTKFLRRNPLDRSFDVYAYHEGKRIGTIEVAVLNGDGFPRIVRARVHDEYQRNGIGTALYYRAAFQCKKLGKKLYSMSGAYISADAVALWNAMRRNGLPVKAIGKRSFVMDLTV